MTIRAGNHRTCWPESAIQILWWWHLNRSKTLEYWPVSSILFGILHASATIHGHFCGKINESRSKTNLTKTECILIECADITLGVCRHVYRCVVDLCDISASPSGFFVADTCRGPSYSTLLQCHLDRIAKLHQRRRPCALLQYHHIFYIYPYPIYEQRPNYTFL